MEPRRISRCAKCGYAVPRIEGKEAPRCPKCGGMMEAVVIGSDGEEKTLKRLEE